MIKEDNEISARPMLTMTATRLPVDLLRNNFGDAIREQVRLAPYTSARIGGPAEVLLIVQTAEELSKALRFIWEHHLNYYILGGGSNILVSDKGFRGVVVLNRARLVRFSTDPEPTVWAESGAVFSNLANRCAAKGLAGIEWASAVPGTIGGAVYGNAGAFEGDVSGCLVRAEMLTLAGLETWPVNKFGYGYRTSILKRGDLRAAVLSAELALSRSDRTTVSKILAQFGTERKASQPPGASMGSMFKNPPGDFAGRLIEVAGLKGARIGNAQISDRHANFFINHGQTQARDVRALIDLAVRTVRDKCAVDLELEIELVGEW
jgi:UDP-N-acetylmuramate dehydrogenase